jgi:hypothetical protein
MVARAGAGPRPIPHRQLTPAALADAIRYLITPEAAAAAAGLSAQMHSEDGVSAAVRSIHANLPLDRMRCAVLPDRPAAWEVCRGPKRVRLSKDAEAVLREYMRVDEKSVSL